MAHDTGPAKLRADMLRVYLLIAGLLLGGARLLAQGFGDFGLLVNAFDETRYPLYLRAARHDGDSTKVVMLKGLYGKFLVHQQRYAEAEAELLGALDLIHKLGGDLRPHVVLVKPSIDDTYDNLGEYYAQTGDNQKAEYYLKQSEQVRQLHFSKGSPYRIVNLQTLAEFYLRSGQTSIAETYFGKLIYELNHTRFNNEMLRAAYGAYFNGMTEISIREGRLAQAKYFFKKLVKFNAGPFSSYRGALHKQTGSSSRSDLFRSRILAMDGHLDDALAVLQSGLRKRPDSLQELPLLLQAKVICLFQQKNNAEALNTARQLLNVHLRNIKKMFNTLNEEEQEAMFDRVKDDFDLYNSIVIVAASQRPLEPQYLSDLLTFRLQTKALLLNYSRKVRRAIFASHDTVLIRDYQRLSWLRNKVSKEVYRKSSKNKMAVLVEEIKSLEKTVARRVATHAGTFETALGWQDVQQALRDDEAAVEMIRVRKLGIASHLPENHRPVYALTDTIQYFAIVLDRERIRYASLTDGNNLEGKFRTLFRNEVMLTTADTTLYHEFWSALTPATGHKKKLYFSGDGVYNQININLLKNKNGYLQDQVDIVLLSNLKEVALPGANVAPGTAVFFGQPNFTLSVVPKDIGTHREVNNFQLQEMKESTFTDLPGTRIEISNGSKALHDAGWETRTYTGDEALESNVKSARNPELLHIATHGFFLEATGVNPMLRSGLIFSGVKNSDDIQGEDGVLTAYEASNLDLDSTSLVVLSACETGSGEERTGEGVYGLQRAFQIAGASNIMMSLWKVDDEATQKLMTLFYRQLAGGKTIRESFSIAQQTLRREYPEPYYWGAFVLIGK
jgi:CHAT domain-containing protein